MRIKRIFLLFLVLISVANAAELDEKTLNLPITLTTGEVVKLTQYKNSKPIYIKFWASYCAECIQQMPHLQKTYQQYGDKVQIIAINIGVDDDLKTVTAVKKQFGLTMPLAIDQSGELAKAFNLIATPYHVLLDKQAKLVYAEYVKTAGIDKRLALFAKGKAVNAKAAVIEKNAKNTIGNIDETQKPTALFFVSTWCDWYLKDTRPLASKHCITAQTQANVLHKKYPNVNWVGVATRLWTGEPELAKYKKRFNVQYKLLVDTSNDVIFKYKVKNYPTLILLDKGQEVFRTQDLNQSTLIATLAELNG